MTTAPATPQWTPTDEDFDDMHHALGRPAGAFEKTYRNFFVGDASGLAARRFAKSGWWDQINLVGKSSAVFRVNEEGRAALDPWLRARALGQGEG